MYNFIANVLINMPCIVDLQMKSINYMKYIKKTYDNDPQSEKEDMVGLYGFEAQSV